MWPLFPPPRASAHVPLVGVLIAWTALAGAASPAAEPAPSFATDVQPFLGKYCLDCHSATKHKGDLDLERFLGASDARREPRVWQGVIEQVAGGEMPPKDKPKPDDAERTRFLGRINGLLDEIGRAQAGDPGPVVLRRLSNAEYTYTLRDLTAVPTLDPAREFPVDGASGEGFMNAGNGLVMSPTLLTKYLDAARDIAAHLVLLPDGLRFSPSTTRRDWTDEVVARIRGFYREFADPRGGTRVNLQGLTWETNEGGRLPVEKYLHALLEGRETLTKSPAQLDAWARERGLSPKYLGRLWRELTSGEAPLLLADVRRRFHTASPDDAPSLASEIDRWQKALWKFNSVGHIGKVGGPTSWMEAVAPLAARQEIRLKLPPAGTNTTATAPVTVRLIATDAGDGPDHDTVIWDRPRLVAPGRPDLLLRDVRSTVADLSRRRTQVLGSVTGALAAAATVETAAESGHAADGDVLAEIARQHGVEPAVLRGWLDYLGLDPTGPATLTGHLTGVLTNGGGFEFVRGWGSPNTPSIMANASDKPVRIPGNAKAHGVVVHPSPTLQVAVGWRSPVAARLRVAATVAHAHPECGNGVQWVLELRRGATRQRLARGVAQGGKPVPAGPFEGVSVRPGDAIVLRIDPRDGNHACDLTAVDLKLTADDGAKEWDLAADVSLDLLAGNPHADRQGNDGVWHFFTEPVVAGEDPTVVIPAGSLLAQWRSARDPGERTALAGRLERSLREASVTSTNDADAVVRRQVTALGGPLLQAVRRAAGGQVAGGPGEGGFGLDAARFGRHPDGPELDAASLGVHAPALVEFTLPADLVEGAELVTTGRLETTLGAEGSVQLRATVNDAQAGPALTPEQSIVVNDGSAARRRLAQGLEAFRDLFPGALAYTKIVPVDEVVTLTLFHREDDALRRLMLDDAQAATLDRWWDELRFVSQDALTLVDAFAQLMEYATQDADPKVFEPLRRPIQERAAAFRKRLLETEPRQLEAALAFAGRAYRRPLTDGEAKDLRELYAKLRKQELSHEDAVRLVVARVLVAPAFLYRAEEPGPGREAVPVNDWEIASRLSYFLWSSAPDAELLSVAAGGRLHEPDVLAAQARRMLREPRVRRLATEFGCQWLHVHSFDELNEKSERHFPTFTALRGAMYEEAIQCFTAFFHENEPVTDLLAADHTYLNGPLAAHYGIPGVDGEAWRRVDGVQRYGRGGLLGWASTLARQSGASRTSPILRGNWISEVVLGEKLPKPPKDVPRLPEDETATEGLTVRQLVEKHSQDPRCAGCHARIDPCGFALEGYDAVGRARTKDLGDRIIDAHARTADGAEFNGLDGLRGYLLTQRREAFLRQFNRKLLGYALGRGVQLSDGPLLDEMRARINQGGGRVADLIETIVRSRQFREIRGKDWPDDNAG